MMLQLKPLDSFCRSTQGSIAIVASVTLLATMMATGMAVDYVVMKREASRLQAAADAGAIAGAREIPVSNSNRQQIEGIATSFTSTNLGLGNKQSGSNGSSSGGNAPLSNSSSMTMSASSDTGDGGGGGGSGDGSTKINATMNEIDNSVVVEIEKTLKPYFWGLFGKDEFKVHARAKAQLAGSEKICVLGLDETQEDTIRLTRSARLTAQQCIVVSNSNDPMSINAGSRTTLHAMNIYSAGGYQGPATSFDPLPITDSPRVPDPLADRAPPPVGACDETDLEISADATLSPGTYCGGIIISQHAHVVFRPGIYVIKDGNLNVVGQSTVQGENVGFYFSGAGSSFQFSIKTTVSLTAPKDGPMAGLLFFEDRNATPYNMHRIGSDNARLLLGTIYLPQGKLIIDANKPVADLSAYTALVIRKMDLKAGPNVVLNSDYGLTDIPVPKGLTGMSGGRIVLKQ